MKRLRGNRRRAAWLATGMAALAFLAIGMTAASAQETRTQKLSPRHWTVYLLPHSHNDIGYTHLQPEVERKQWQNIDEVLELCRKTADYPPAARFKWNTEVVWAVEQLFCAKPRLPSNEN